MDDSIAEREEAIRAAFKRRRPSPPSPSEIVPTRILSHNLPLRKKRNIVSLSLIILNITVLLFLIGTLAGHTYRNAPAWEKITIDAAELAIACGSVDAAIQHNIGSQPKELLGK